MAQGLLNMLDPQDLDCPPYNPTYGFLEATNQQDDIASLEREIINAARQSETHKHSSSHTSKRKSRLDETSTHSSHSAHSSHSTTHSADGGPATKKRCMKRKPDLDQQKISTFAKAATSSSSSTTSRPTKSSTQTTPATLSMPLFQQTAEEEIEEPSYTATLYTATTENVHQQSRQASQTDSNGQFDQDSSFSAPTAIPTATPTYEDYRTKMVTVRNVLENVTFLAQAIDLPLRKHTDICEKELQTVVDHYHNCMKSSCCFFCNQSPTVKPQRVKATACGHFFSCLQCFLTYFNNANGTFYCPRCNTAGAITIE